MGPVWAGRRRCAMPAVGRDWPATCARRAGPLTIGCDTSASRSRGPREPVRGESGPVVLRPGPLVVSGVEIRLEVLRKPPAGGGELVAAEGRHGELPQRQKAPQRG